MSAEGTCPFRAFFQIENFRVSEWRWEHFGMAMVSGRMLPSSSSNLCLFPVVWRARLFVIEGIATVIVGIAAIFLLPGKVSTLDDPAECANSPSHTFTPQIIPITPDGLLLKSE
jgi:hypothetical protein